MTEDELAPVLLEILKRQDPCSYIAPYELRNDEPGDLDVNVDGQFNLRKVAREILERLKP